MTFKINCELKIEPINKFYERIYDITTLGDKEPQLRRDFIFVVGVEPQTGMHFYYNFNDFNYLFTSGNRLLTCDKVYIDGFCEISLEKLIQKFD